MLYLQLTFTSAVSWHFHDVDIELSPPVEITYVSIVENFSVVQYIDINFYADLKNCFDVIWMFVWIMMFTKQDIHM